MQQIRTRTRPGPPQEPHAHHPAPAHPRHRDDPALRAAVPGEKGFNMKVIQRMVLKTRSTRVAATCSDESSSSGRLFGGVWMRLPGAMRRIVERWGAGAGRDDPFESPAGVLEGVGRGGVGGLVVRGGSGAPPHRPSRMVGRRLTCRDAAGLLGPLACGWNWPLECEVRVSAPGGRGDRRGRRPRRDPRGRRLSKSVAKARIEPGLARRTVDIPRFHSPLLPARSAFATDLDTPPPRTAPGAPCAPPPRPPVPITEPIRTRGPQLLTRKAQWSHHHTSKGDTGP